MGHQREEEQTGQQGDHAHAAEFVTWHGRPCACCATSP
ncbi:hypothetical protein DVS28_a0549 [Euzebya pacifica]|uniref:Uncharacterized protein n=1 Tax=Euzebya pacifica TaxID=1608957 RepID=A0A346XSQ9_9ACTN|nr:hypothetical protein DVS28_a0549 [Euzebya pacifica]